MSVVRYSEESDVYMWPVGDARFDCACGVRCESVSAATDHLAAHKAKGDKVPLHAFHDLSLRDPKTGSYAIINREEAV